MDTELLLAFAILAGFGMATLFERRAKARARAAAASAPPPRMCVFAKLPESMTPILDAALQRESLGKVTSSGAGVTVELVDLERGLAFMKRELLRLGVPKDTMLEFTRNGVQVAESVMELHLEPGTRYRVIKSFVDHDRDLHPEGEEWTFLRSAFVPYHSGMSWFVSFDGVEETHIRLQSIPEEQGEILNNLAEYLVAV
jgi:hypothetical protein